MRLLLIAILSVVLFFPLYWALHPFLGPNWAAGIAALMMYIGFPTVFLFKWRQRSSHSVIKLCNYGLAVLTLVWLAWVCYGLFFNNAPIPNSIALVAVYGYLAVYFLKNGYMPYQVEEPEPEPEPEQHQPENRIPQFDAWAAFNHVEIVEKEESYQVALRHVDKVLYITVPFESAELFLDFELNGQAYYCTWYEAIDEPLDECLEYIKKVAANYLFNQVRIQMNRWFVFKTRELQFFNEDIWQSVFSVKMHPTNGVGMSDDNIS